ncbi:uncharacterized protein KNAG_0D00340 [Huiozyma naganishii CBS 8797]|uniref:Uncharacterized protein n=1 Tax=Huiozyma naganishii (strain ATCC MYA-139 / BCRC 22969 / CBS 8797 / KCTC 17520 / NBRC 10181 / NCYC 3082 / Yp74L-3) TaxID=1071383 RepID=J7RXH6_HUIN7|nr:hypothetical protein KNAG_0D00340 [Kazachstania naganishii CBS 8797]CCK69787.1 hypothetical protein KNAG_0D00340 [Kazachstania naganishii CBS 8797]
MVWFVVVRVVSWSVYGTFAAINRYFHYKTHWRDYPLTLAVVTVNMLLLLMTDFMLPLDIFHTSLWDRPAGDTTGPELPIGANATAGLPLSLLKREQPQGQAARGAFYVVWPTVYWLQFVICWFAIPVLISYIGLKYAAAYEEKRRKFVMAVYSNLKFYLLCLLGVAVGVVYLVFSTGHAIREFKPLLISMAHLYSLSYTLILLSRGVVLLPRALLNFASVPTTEAHNSLYVELSRRNDDLNDSQVNVLESAAGILQTQEVRNGDVLFNQLLLDCQQEVRGRIEGLNLQSVTGAGGSSGTSQIASLDKLNKTYNKFITHYYNYCYYQNQSNTIIHVLAQTGKTQLDLVRKYVIVALGVVSTVLSAFIVVLEVSPTKWAHGWVFLGSSWYNFILVFVILTYNTVASLYAMSQIKFSNFHLIANGGSNPANVLYYSLYSSRLLFPLCFNLMTLIPAAGSPQDESVFAQTLYGDVTLIPLVNALNKYLPPVFLVLVPLSFKYDIKEKILLRVLGEDYYYQFFGMMPYDPDSVQDDIEGSRTHVDEDYQYFLEDGRYLFERASANNVQRADSIEIGLTRASREGTAVRETTTQDDTTTPLSYI